MAQLRSVSEKSCRSQRRSGMTGTLRGISFGGNSKVLMSIFLGFCNKNEQARVHHLRTKIGLPSCVAPAVTQSCGINAMPSRYEQAHVFLWGWDHSRLECLKIGRAEEVRERMGLGIVLFARIGPQSSFYADFRWCVFVRGFVCVICSISYNKVVWSVPRLVGVAFVGFSLFACAPSLL